MSFSRNDELAADEALAEYQAVQLAKYERSRPKPPEPTPEQRAAKAAQEQEARDLEAERARDLLEILREDVAGWATSEILEHLYRADFESSFRSGPERGVLLAEIDKRMPARDK